MKTLKKEAIEVISKLPETANLEEIMYRLYIIDKVKKGLAATQTRRKPYEPITISKSVT
ncbi:hypothetical protein [Sporomusa termitida]|uniref:hypothetical protein n=1 Tax=Sporomusa termitida TaxID=2377 RepID=UPI0014793220|nr:hypothetical protein [Sporomusa termitida]